MGARVERDNKRTLKFTKAMKNTLVILGLSVLLFVTLLSARFATLALQQAKRRPSPDTHSHSALTRVWLEVDDNAQRKLKGYVEQDTAALFATDTPWQGVSVFGINELAVLTASDQSLQSVFGFLKDHHIALDMNTTMLPVGTNECGKRGTSTMESYTNNPNDLMTAVQRIARLGGDLRYVDMDEPLFYGSLPIAGGCRYSPNQISGFIGREAVEIRHVFPKVEIGDSEPILGDIPPQYGMRASTWTTELEAWEATYRKMTGKPLSFFHADINWQAPIESDTKTWAGSLQEAWNYFEGKQIPFGIYYNGDGATSDTSWTQYAISRYQYIESTLRIVPQDAVIYSWGNNPTRLLPDTEKGTLTYLLRQYVAWRTNIPH